MPEIEFPKIDSIFFVFRYNLLFHIKKVLVICFFHPVAAGGVFRALKFVKYLKQHGWEPTVLTAKPIGAWVTDRSLLDEIDCDVHYTKSFHPVGLFRSQG